MHHAYAEPAERVVPNDRRRLFVFRLCYALDKALHEMCHCFVWLLCVLRLRSMLTFHVALRGSI